MIKKATFGMGWFWGPDAQYGLIDGVIRTRVGYSGGNSQNPTYTNMMDHTEVVQIDYDEDIITYDELLAIFWKNNIYKMKSLKVQYKSLILYHDKEQRTKALKSKDEKEKNENTHIYTDIEYIDKFYLAENYHQKYYLQSLRTVSNDIKKSYKNFNDFVDSKIAARLNGYIKGYGDINMLRHDLKTDLLSDKSKKRLISIVDGYGD